MDLNQRYSQIKLPKFEDFVNYYLSVMKKYISTYGNDKTKFSWGQHDIIILLWSINYTKHKKTTHPLYFT